MLVATSLRIMLMVYMIYIVPCVNLTQPNNGVMNCSVRDDAVSFQNSCSFMCNIGFMLNGSDTRFCHNGSWTGDEAFCNRGTTQFNMAILYIYIYIS